MVIQKHVVRLKPIFKVSFSFSFSTFINIIFLIWLLISTSLKNLFSLKLSQLLLLLIDNVDMNKIRKQNILGSGKLISA